MDRIKFKLGFSNGLCVLSRGQSGGLALLWSSDTKLEIMSYSNHHIDAIITEADDGIVWRFTSFMDSWRPTSGKNLGNSSHILIANLICHGFAMVILMKFFQCLKKQVVSIVAKIRWMVSVKL